MKNENNFMTKIRKNKIILYSLTFIAIISIIVSISVNGESVLSTKVFAISETNIDDTTIETSINATVETSTTEVQNTNNIEQSTTINNEQKSETYQNNNVTTKKVNCEKITKKTVKPMERVFTVNGIKIDATGSSAFDETLIYVKELTRGLPKIHTLARFKNIVLTDEITVYGANANTVGLADNGGKTIYMKTHLQSKKQLKSTLYHELGHLVDCHLGGGPEYSISRSWGELVSKEGHEICKFYGIDLSGDEYNSKRECFAMAFEAYYLGSINGVPFNLKSKCPKIYEQIDKMLSAKYEVIEHCNGMRHYFKTIDEVYEWVYNFTTNETEANTAKQWCTNASYGEEIHSNWGYGIECRK